MARLCWGFDKAADESIEGSDIARTTFEGVLPQAEVTDESTLIQHWSRRISNFSVTVVRAGTGT